MKPTQKTIHLVFNAHLDPVWLWGWQDGVDETLATCRTACDLLDANPDLIFTRGEAWVYEQIERLDPALFERIRAHIETGRWEPIGGWYVQPDCNLPTWRGFEKQIEIGKTYFEDRIGKFPEIAYNVDSFGHAATLPTLMRRAGQRFYVMMRPQEDELKLPSRLFRWSYEPGTEEVVTFRIPNCYCTPEGITREFVEESLTELPPGIDHAMCFVGLGDHGGGPSQAMIEWCRAHQDFAPGVRLEFSSPRRFFEAVSDQLDTLPLVTGELYYHAVGCYTSMSDIKLMLKRAERRLEQAEQHPKLLPEEREELARAWKWACFHEFHDTIGGTCLPSAYTHVRHEIGAAEAAAERVMAYAIRREVAQLPPDPLQRIVCGNPSSEPWSGWTEAEPWLEWTQWGKDWRLLDESGAEVPFQEVDAEGMHIRQTRLLFNLEIPPHGMRILRIEREGRKANTGSATTAPSVLQWGDAQWPSLQTMQGLLQPELVLREDLTDAWGHGINRFDGPIVSHAEWEAPEVVEEGPLRWTWIQEGKIGEASTLRAEWRLWADSPDAELILRVHWHERRRIAKLELRDPSGLSGTLAGIPGGSQRRGATGQEFAVQDWIQAERDGTPVWSLACPDIFAADCQAERVAISLLRSIIMAQHDPNPGTSPRREYSDQGEHVFRFHFALAPTVTSEWLVDRARRYFHQPVIANTTKGMPRRYMRGEVGP